MASEVLFWVMLRWCVKNLLRYCLIIERGTGGGLWKSDNIMEARMFAEGKKPYGQGEG